MHRLFIYRMAAFIAVVLLSLPCLVRGGQEPSAGTTLSLEGDGRGFTFAVPGVMTAGGTFSATLASGGTTQLVSSLEGKLLGPVQQVEEETPCGKVVMSVATLTLPSSPIQLLFRVGRLPDHQGMTAQAGICNQGAEPVRLLTVTPVALAGRVEGRLADWLVTRLDTSSTVAPPVQAVSEIEKPLRVFEYGSLYSKEGRGFVFGPVGDPIAYLHAIINHRGEGNLEFSFVAQMDGVQVKPGETRWGQQVALLTQPPQKALARWADWVAQTHQARTDKGALWGWNSWSFHGAAVTVVLGVAAEEAVPAAQALLLSGIKYPPARRL